MNASAVPYEGTDCTPEEPVEAARSKRVYQTHDGKWYHCCDRCRVLQGPYRSRDQAVLIRTEHDEKNHSGGEVRDTALSGVTVEEADPVMGRRIAARILNDATRLIEANDVEHAVVRMGDALIWLGTDLAIR